MIGNGFDLAHELPTTYIDFLEFCKALEVIYKDNIGGSELWKKYLSKYKQWDPRISFLSGISGNRDGRPEMKTFFENIYDNKWIMYFQEQCDRMGKNWIDFESEISKIIQQMEMVKGCTKYEKLKPSQADELFCLAGLMKSDMEVDDYLFCHLNDLKEILENDLNRLIYAFEIYLSEFVN